MRILHEAEATGSLLEPVQPHDDPLHLPTHGEELVDLFLRGVEGEIAHVQRGAVPELEVIVILGQLEGEGAVFETR